MSGWGNGHNPTENPNVTVTVTNKTRGGTGGAQSRPVAVDMDTPLWPTDRRARAPEDAHDTAYDAAPFPGGSAQWRERGGERPGLSERFLRPEDYLTEPVEPPEMGWRREAWRLGARRLRPSARELRHRDWTRQIRRSLRSPKVVAVFSPKGGVGKTTTTLQLGQVLSTLRGDLVAALDANPDSGNLVKRVREPYSVATAGELHRDRANVVRYADLMPYLTQSDSGLCVVRCDPSAAARLGPQEYREILELLTRFYSMVMIDLGTGMRESAFLSILDVADAVVAVSRPTFDAAEVLAEGLHWLAVRFPHKIAAATMVLNAVESRPGQLDTDRLTEQFGHWVGRILSVPYDRHLAGGGVPQWPLLARHTQDSYLELAAGIVGSLPNERPNPLCDRHGSPT